MELFADGAVGAAVRLSSYDPDRVVAYEVRGFTPRCENNPSQAQLFDQHATGSAAQRGGRAEANPLMSCTEAPTN